MDNKYLIKICSNIFWYLNTIKGISKYNYWRLQIHICLYLIDLEIVLKTISDKLLFLHLIIFLIELEISLFDLDLSLNESYMSKSVWDIFKWLDIYE